MHYRVLFVQPPTSHGHPYRLRECIGSTRRLENNFRPIALMFRIIDSSQPESKKLLLSHPTVPFKERGRLTWPLNISRDAVEPF